MNEDARPWAVVTSMARHAGAVLSLGLALAASACGGGSSDVVQGPGDEGGLEGAAGDATTDTSPTSEGGADGGGDSAADVRTDQSVPTDSSTTDSLVDAPSDRSATDGSGVCTPGATQCSGNGVETCDATGNWGAPSPCTNQTCSGGVCLGNCAPGQMQCTGNGVQTCTTGMWGIPVPCVNAACVSGACTGMCTPGALQCSGNGVETCDSTGTWSAPSACTNQTCVAGTCTGMCAPGQTQCNGNGVETCTSNGTWGTPVPCAGSACVGGVCAGTCSPGSVQCSGNGVQTCGAGGTWGNPVACVSSTCIAGVCSGVCAVGATQCSGNGVETCSATGSWGSAVACMNQTCVGGVCAGVCAPGQTTCSGNTPQTCSATGTWTNETACAAGQACSAGTCICDAASCPAGCCQGATCQPGNTTSACGTGGGSCTMCSASQTCTSGACANPVCGNAVRETGEQCDDGNTTNLDGCDSTCQFEQDTRATRLLLQWAHDAYCTHDVLLEAVKDPAFANVHSTIQGDLDTYVTSGATSVLLKYFAITDLSGQSGKTSVGSYNGAPVAYTGAFNGNADLDWWYTLDATTAGGKPLYTPTAIQSPGTFTGGVLNAAGGHVLISAFGVSLLDMASIKMQLPIASPATTPGTSAGAPPGHLASEHLDPLLTSFGRAGGANAAPTGLLCGNVTAASLAGTPVPAQLQSNCNQGYGATNNMLDVFVGGCTAPIVGTIIAVVQPDQTNPDAPPAGAGGLYRFQESATHHVNGCTDKSGAVVSPYTACLAPAAYSMYVKFAADRVILKHP